MSMYPTSAECPWCGGFDGWVGARVSEHLRCTCDGSVDHLSLINSPDLRASLARVAKNACEDALTRQVEAELLRTMAMQSRRAA